MWLLSACAPRPPDEAWLLRLHGEPVGVDRRFGDRIERTLVVDVGGRGVVQRADRGTEGWDGLVHVPPSTGTWPMTGPDGVIPRAVVRDGPVASWWTPSGEVRVELDDAGVVRWRAAGLTGDRVDPGAPDPPALDVAAVLTRPAPAFPRARQSHVGRYRVGAEEVRVEAPLRAELPRDAPAERVVRAVAAELPDGADPFGTAAGAFGDCTEHAAAFVARARADGLAAEPVFGLLVADGALRPHAWATVDVGGRWVAVDPALGQFPADAGHLPLGPGVEALARADGLPVTVLELR